jgi:hypothetical protein
MRTTFVTLAAALFAAVVSANSKANAFSNPAGGYSFTVGKATTLTWNADSGTTVTLRLQSGEVSTANSGTIIACEYSIAQIPYHIYPCAPKQVVASTYRIASMRTCAYPPDVSGSIPIPIPIPITPLTTLSKPQSPFPQPTPSQKTSQTNILSSRHRQRRQLHLVRPLQPPLRAGLHHRNHR